MRLYDSNGNVREVNPKDIRHLTNDNIGEVMGFISGILDDKNTFHRTSIPNMNCVLIYQTKETKKDDFSLPYNKVCGALFQFNQVDGKIANVSYINSTEEKVKAKDFSTIFTLDKYYTTSVEDEEMFPQIKAVLDKAKKEITGKDYYSVNKNQYLVCKEASNSFVDKAIPYKRFMELKNNSILKLDAKGNYYRDNTIYFSVNGQQDHFDVFSDVIIYGGNLYTSMDDFLTAYQKGIQLNMLYYGNDPMFKDAVFYNKNLDIKVEEDISKSATFDSPEEEEELSL